MNRIISCILFCTIISFSLSAQLLSDTSDALNSDAYSYRDAVAALQGSESIDNLDPMTADVFAMTPLELLGEDDDDTAAYDDLDATLLDSPLKNELVSYAKKYLGCRYVHGGKGPTVFDCSGFTSYVFRNFGYTLSPASRMQGTQGSRVANMKDVEVGDLMFFSGRAGGKTVGHVGMVIDVDPENGTLKFIHASCKRGVTIQSYPAGGYYSKHFLHVQRVLDTPALLSQK